MLDPYSVLGISQGADEETIKKAYRQKCKQYHPDLHPDDPTCEDKFKEVQAAYSEIMRQRQGGGNSGAQNGYSGYSSYGGASGQRSYRQSGQSGGYQDPFGFGFGFDPFGFGFGYSGAGQSAGRDTPEMQAANNYIRNGYYQEALNVLEGIAANERTARWHYYAALACAGLGNNIRAQNEARTAVDMEPGNYENQKLLDPLQNPGRTNRTYQQAHTQPGGGNPLIRFCLTLWVAQLFFALFNCCCCGSGRYYYC